MARGLGHAARARARALACACVLGAWVPACSTPEGGGDSDDDGPGASGGSGSSAVTDSQGAQGAQSGAGAVPAASAGEGAPPGAVDAGPPLPEPLPPCAQMPLASDAGVSPYDGACVDESIGVFASPMGADAPRGDGSRSRPLRSLQDAIGLALRTDRDVYACAGTYEGALQVGSELSDGLRIFGGLACDGFAGPDASGARSVVHATGAAPALRIDDCRSVTIERFELHADREAMPKPGTSYVALSVTDALGVGLRDVVLRTADGEAGADGAAPVGTAADGQDAGDGQDACSRNPNPGGSGALQTECGANMPWIAGGAGGLGGVGSGDGGSGFQQTFPATLGEPAGDSGTWSCTPGSGMAPMPVAYAGMGNFGRGGRGFGALLGGRFVAYGGTAGGDGPPGQGGIGGGGARAPASCSGLGSAVGASGGGGGSGGCGGAGGEGGQAGGSSIGILSLGSEIAWLGGELHVGRGGSGGDGALGQTGGKGGKGGQGGQGNGGASDACDGSDASGGGPGGPGGGGNGGHALGVLYDGEMPVLEDVGAGIDGATGWGGAPGEGPPDMGAPAGIDLVGTEGVTAFVHEF